MPIAPWEMRASPVTIQLMKPMKLLFMKSELDVADAAFLPACLLMNLNLSCDYSTNDEAFHETVQEIRF